MVQALRDDLQINFAIGKVFLNVSLDKQFKMCLLADVDDT